MCNLLLFCKANCFYKQESVTTLAFKRGYYTTRIVHSFITFYCIIIMTLRESIPTTLEPAKYLNINIQTTSNPGHRMMSGILRGFGKFAHMRRNKVAPALIFRCFHSNCPSFQSHILIILTIRTAHLDKKSRKTFCL